MPTLIRVKDTGLKIEKRQGVTKISVNTLFIEKGIQTADIIAMFNNSILDSATLIRADIAEEAQLRIDADMAFSSYLVSLETTYDGNFANISTQIQTLTTDVSAIASSVTNLEVSINGTINVRLQEMANVFAGYFDYTETPESPNFGDLKLDGSVTYQYLGGALGPNLDGWVVYDDTALGISNQVKGWVAGASSLVVDPNTGNVTGWQYGDGSGFSSSFIISADNINLNGTTTIIANADMSNVTTIDGGKINTGVIYNSGGSATSYTMKIDLNAGEIHIK